MTLTGTLQKFFDEVYGQSYWDDITDLENYFAVSDERVAEDLRAWLSENAIPYRYNYNRASHISMFYLSYVRRYDD